MNDLGDLYFVLLSEAGPEFVIRNSLALLGAGSMLALVAIHALIHFMVLALVHFRVLALIHALVFLVFLTVATLILLHIGLIFIATLFLHCALVFVLIFVFLLGFFFLALRRPIGILGIDSYRSSSEQQQHCHTKGSQCLHYCSPPKKFGLGAV